MAKLVPNIVSSQADSGSLTRGVTHTYSPCESSTVTFTRFGRTQPMTSVVPVLDRVLDADSHEMTPLQYWGPIWGPAAGQIAEQVTESLRAQIGNNDFYAPEHKGDVTAIDHDSVWKLKGTSAPGAFDSTRRLDVMNEMGIARQLVFPSFAIFASMAKIGNEFQVKNFLGMMGSIAEIRELGDVGLTEYNNLRRDDQGRRPDALCRLHYGQRHGRRPRPAGRDANRQGDPSDQHPARRPTGGSQPDRPGHGRLLGAAREAQRAAGDARRQLVVCRANR